MDGRDQIRVVLVRPLYGGNIGSVCRGMMNFGFSRLVLVAPREGWDQDEARKYALGTVSILEQRTEAATLDEAVADCVAVTGTTARRGLYRSQAAAPRDWAPEFLARADLGPAALVFGPEDKGLTTDELARCTHQVMIPTSEAYPSMNLSHAVNLLLYELSTAAGGFDLPEEPSPEATVELRERMFAAWEETLRDIGFFGDDKARHMMLGLRRILTRGRLTENDVKILMGIARQARWAGKRDPGSI